MSRPCSRQRVSNTVTRAPGGRRIHPGAGWRLVIPGAVENAAWISSAYAGTSVASWTKPAGASDSARSRSGWTARSTDDGLSRAAAGGDPGARRARARQSVTDAVATGVNVIPTSAW